MPTPTTPEAIKEARHAAFEALLVARKRRWNSRERARETFHVAADHCANVVCELASLNGAHLAVPWVNGWAILRELERKYGYQS